MYQTLPQIKKGLMITLDFSMMTTMRTSIQWVLARGHLPLEFHIQLEVRCLPATQVQCQIRVFLTSHKKVDIISSG